MLELHYDVMKMHFDDAAQLCFTDTDSFIYKVTLTPKILSTYNLEEPEHVTVYDLLNAVNAQKPLRSVQVRRQGVEEEVSIQGAYRLC